jgi:hypothetical protein
MKNNIVLSGLVASLLMLSACQKDENKSNSTPANPAVSDSGDASSGQGGGQSRVVPNVRGQVATLDGTWVSDCRPSHYLWTIPGYQPSRFNREIVKFSTDRMGTKRIRYVIQEFSEFDYNCSSAPDFSSARLDLQGAYTILRVIPALGNVVEVSITHTSCGGQACGNNSNLSAFGILPNEIRYIRIVENNGAPPDMIFGTRGGPMDIRQDLNLTYKLIQFNNEQSAQNW